MGSEQAASVLATVRRDNIEAAGKTWSADEEAKFKQPIREQFDSEADPYYATARLWDDGIIAPSETRRVLALCFSVALNAPIPETKFGCIPDVTFQLFCRDHRERELTSMPKTIEHIHWPDAPDMWMPYAPAIKVKGGTTVYLAGVTAAPVYHHHPHRPEEFDSMPRDMAGQTRAALENLKRGLEAVGASFADIVTADRFVTDLSDQDALNRVWGEYFGGAKPTTTTVQVVRLATDPRCLVEINAVAD